MPLVYQQNINQFTKLGLWHILEPEAFFLQNVPLQKEITHPHKRLQHLAGRYLLRALFPRFPLELIKIADTRKPFLPDEAYHFSISHCGDYAAVMVSTQYRVGVDVEWPQPKIALIKQKFLTAEEEEILKAFGDRDDWVTLTTAWSCKEAIFKWYGLGGLDFKKHMNILEVQQNEMGYRIQCSINKYFREYLEIHSLFIEGNVLAWVATEAANL